MATVTYGLPSPVVLSFLDFVSPCDCLRVPAFCIYVCENRPNRMRSVTVRSITVASRRGMNTLVSAADEQSRGEE